MKPLQEPLSPEEQSFPHPPPFVGREKELGTLRSRVDSARRGRGGLVFVKGEAGVGKTRLLRELETYCEQAQVTWLQGRSYSPTIPYSPWTEALQQFIRRASPQDLKTLCRGPAVQVVRLVPSVSPIIGPQEKETGLRRWLRGPTATTGESPQNASEGTVLDDSGRLAFFEGVTEFLISLSRRKPLVILLEDLDRSDSASLLLLRYATRHVLEDQLLIIGSFREEELDPSHPLWQLVSELEKESLTETIAVDTLSRDQACEIVEKMTGWAGGHRDVGDTIYTATRGNPYFLIETLRSLKDQGIIGRDHAEIGRLKETRLPSSVRSLLKRRLSRLDPQSAEILATAAVVGLEFDYELLVQVAGMAEEQILKHVEASIAAGFLREIDQPATHRLGFSDPRICRILLDDLSTIRRRRLHAKIAEAMERAYSGKTTEYLAQIAHHYVEAGDLDKATRYSLQAGESAASAHAYDEAIRQFRNVVEMAEGTESAGQAKLRTVALQKSIQSWNRALVRGAEIVTLDGFTRIAEFYEATMVPLFTPLAKTIVYMAHLQKGQKVLDVGTGTGLAAFLAAEAVGDSGLVLGIDLSDGMLSIATKKRERSGHGNVEFRKMDETSLELNSNSFEGVVSNLGLTRFDADRALREIHRVVKPGGPVAISGWKKTSKVGGIYDGILRKYRTRNPSEQLAEAREAEAYDERGFSRLTDRDFVIGMLREAGFQQISSVTFSSNPVFTIEEWLNLAHSLWPTCLEVAEMDPGTRASLRKEVEQAVQPFLTPEGIVLDWEFNCFTTRK